MQYNTPDYTGETRTERHERFFQPVPGYDVPEAGVHLWTMFWEIIQSGYRFSSSGAISLSFAELAAWRDLTETTLSPQEVGAIMAMSSAWAKAMDIEIKYSNDKRAAEETEKRGQARD